MTTLEQLRARHKASYITLDELVKHYPLGYSTARGVRRAVAKGALALRLDRLNDSQRAPQIVYLIHLAEYLDARERAARASTNNPAAHHAA